MFDCFWLSVPVQLIVWKDSSPKWPIVRRVWRWTIYTHSLTLDSVDTHSPWLSVAVFWALTLVITWRADDVAGVIINTVIMNATENRPRRYIVKLSSSIYRDVYICRPTSLCVDCAISFAKSARTARSYNSCSAPVRVNPLKPNSSNC